MKRPASGRVVLATNPHRAPPAAPAAGALAALAAQLEGVLVEAIAGRSAHEALEGTLQREARAVLLRHGLGEAQVGVEQAGGEFRVHVRLPGAGPRVLQVRVSLDG